MPPLTQDEPGEGAFQKLGDTFVTLQPRHFPWSSLGKKKGIGYISPGTRRETKLISVALSEGRMFWVWAWLCATGCGVVRRGGGRTTKQKEQGADEPAQILTVHGGAGAISGPGP